MVKKSFVEEKKTAGAIAHTVGLTKEQYFEKLEELGLDYNDRFAFSSSVAFAFPSVEKVCDFRDLFMETLHESYGDYLQFYYVIPKNNDITTFYCFNSEIIAAANTFVPCSDEVKGRNPFLAFIEGDDGQFYMYGDTYSEGSGTSVA